MNIEYVNPGNMMKPRGYSHAVSVSGDHKTVFIGGQNAVDEKGNVVGKNDLGKQSERILMNIESILDQAGAKFENIIKMNIFLLQGQNPQEGFQAFQKVWGENKDFPAVTVLFVAGLGHPDWLVEIEAIAVVPE